MCGKVGWAFPDHLCRKMEAEKILKNLDGSLAVVTVRNLDNEIRLKNLASANEPDESFSED